MFHDTGGYNNPYSPARYYNPSYSTPSYGYGMYPGYSNYGYRPYGMYGGGTGYGYGSGQMNNDDSIVFRQAEERTRSAFQSVESVVGVFASVTMMLESTYIAVQSCFRALIGVAEHFSRMKNQLWSIISAISILQRIKHFIRQILHLLRIRNYSETDYVWGNISSVPTHSLSQGSQRLWPVAMFFTVIVGVPWLLWRLLASAVSQSDDENSSMWSESGSTDGNSVARALYDFTAERSNELSITTGDELVVAPRQVQPNVPGWILVGKNRRSGLVPANYIEILPTPSPQLPQLSPSDD